MNIGTGTVPPLTDVGRGNGACPSVHGAVPVFTNLSFYTENDKLQAANLSFYTENDKSQAANLSFYTENDKK